MHRTSWQQPIVEGPACRKVLFCSGMLYYSYKFTTVYCVLCTVYCILCTVYTIQYTIYCVLYTVYCILCTVYSILYTVYWVILATNNFSVFQISADCDIYILASFSLFIFHFSFFIVQLLILVLVLQCSTKLATCNFSESELIAKFARVSTSLKFPGIQ